MAPIHIGVVRNTYVVFILCYEGLILLANLNDELQLEFAHSWDSPHISGFSMTHKVVR